MLFGKYLNRYYRKYWYLFLLIIIADTIVDLVQLLVPRIVGDIVNNLTPDPVTGEIAFTIYPTEELSFFQTDFFLTLLSVFLIAVIIVVGRMGWRYASSRIGALIERDLRREMFSHIQTLSISFYRDRKTGGLLSYFTNDLQTIKMVFTDGLIFLTDLVVLGITAFFYMFSMSVPITLCAALPLVLFIIFGAVVGKGESKRFTISSDAFEDLSDFTEETLQGFQVVKSFRKERERIDRFRSLSKEAETTSVSYLRYSSLIDFGINVFICGFFAILASLACLSILGEGVFFEGDNLVQAGDFITYIGYYDALIWPMFAGGMLIDYISRGRGAYKRIASILDEKPDVNDRSDTPSHQSMRGEVEFKDLTFSYPDGQVPSLVNVSLKINAGETIGIIGRTGEGKSTLINLLLKLYQIEEGKIFIDQEDINSWREKDLRNFISLVSQEAFLFSGPLKYSIAFSEDNPEYCDIERVKKAASFACVDKEIEEFPDGYETIIKEKGASLSGGQRQRISIARAIYKDPSILMLDDSLSAVDADTEKRILKNIKEERKGKTTIIVAHRISAIEEADRIAVIDKGEIIAFDKHDALLKTCPLYQDIVHLQELEKEVSYG